MTRLTAAAPENGGRPRYGFRAIVALWIGKCAGKALRLVGREGTHVPGRIALWLCPGILGTIARPSKVVVVTGTNGKTTTTNLLADALDALGYRVSSNRFGSNLRAGIVATLVEGVTWGGTCRNDVAVLELDERSALRVLPELAPDVFLCTNLTRDSIKRNAHPEYIAWILTSALSAATKLVLNADDLVSASLGSELNVRVFYGVDPTGNESLQPSGAAVDVYVCPRCDEPLTWDFWRFNHIGKVRCLSCGFASPSADVHISLADGVSGLHSLSINTETFPVHLVNQSVVNVYNVAAVAGALSALEISPQRIATVVETLTPTQTRFAEEEIGGVRLVRLLTKGLVGVACSRAFEHIRLVSGSKIVLLAVDETTDRFDGVENTAWTYDADYEFLADPSIHKVYVGGIRRHDQALRLAMAGVDPDRIVLVESETEAANLVPLDHIDTVFNLHSNHNAVSTGDAVQNALRNRLQELNS